MHLLLESTYSLIQIIYFELLTCVREVMFLPLYVGLCVSRVTQKLSANFGEIIWRGGMHDWEQVIRFW